MTRNNNKGACVTLPEVAGILRTLARDASDGLMATAFPSLLPDEARQGLRRLAAGTEAPPYTPVKTEGEPPIPKPATEQGLHLQLFTDGAARGNPGPAGAGIVLRDSDGAEVLAKGKYLGHCTNNVAEYQAVLGGLREALGIGVRSVDIFLDSELIVRQIQGRYRVKDAKLIPLHAAVSEELSRFVSWKVSHVPRHMNSRADELANEGIDRR